MHRRGRVHWLLLATGAAIVVLAALAALSAESPEGAAQAFMVALAKGDATTLADRSYFKPPRERAAKIESWKKTLDRAEYFRFVWRFKGFTVLPNDRATVSMEFVRDAGTKWAYEENFSLDLVKEGGRWKVDVLGLSREMYPALPR